MFHLHLEEKLLELHSHNAGGRFTRTLRSPFRMIVPAMMRRLGITREVSIPTFWGGNFTGLLPEAVSTVTWRSSYFDAQVCLALLRYLRPGATFVDIGAHFGFFTLLASHLVGHSGRVISIEAMPSTFQWLKKNVERNGSHGNVSLHQGAAFDTEIELEFFDFGVLASSLNSAFGSRGDQSLIKETKKVSVSAQRADTILQAMNVQRVDLIKIDAESSEKFVLAGLTETIKRDRPVVVMEVGDIGVTNGTPSAEVIGILANQGYSVLKWHGNELRPFSSNGLVEYANLVFVLPDGEETSPVTST